MDRQSLIGFVLIAVIITAWMTYNSTTTRPTPKPAATAQRTETKVTPEIPANLPPIAKVGNTFAQFTQGGEKIFTVETDLYKAEITSRGGAIKSWTLKGHDNFKGRPAQLISYSQPEFALSFTSNEGKKIDTRELHFEISPNENNYQKISGVEDLTVIARLVVADGSEIERKYIFHGNKFGVDASVNLHNMEQFIPTRRYDLSWSNGLRYQEKNSVDESSNAVAIASLNGELEELDAAEAGKTIETNNTGLINYAATRSKYFLAAIVQKEPMPDATVFLEGKNIPQKDNGVIEKYSMTYRFPYKGGDQTQNFLLYVGPLQYDLVKEYGLEGTVNLGWKWLVRPIGEFFMLPIFKFVHRFVPNYGFAIILFSILMKLLLYPLSIQQTKSAAKMQLLAPKMTELREKYKDDPTKQQQETMRIYREYGINPAGGCLPLLLQMPILYALYSVLSHSIELRHQPFFGWIHDLSIPDVVVNFGFSLPLLGLSHLSGLALLMGATLFFQQKMTISDPRQKAMIYMMPVLFTVMFSNLPAGLNLYYFTFNLLGILQQLWITKFSKNKLTLEDLKKNPGKESWLQKKMREAQEIAASQGRTLPGQPPLSNGQPRGQNATKKQPGKKK